MRTVWNPHDRKVYRYDEHGVATFLREFTDEENAAADATITSSARLDDHEARLAAIEAALWPADPDPEPGVPVTAPTWADLDPPGWWRNETLLADGGTIWRNVSGTVLTSPPSGLPGGGTAWIGQLFIEVTTSDPDPDPEPEPEPERPEGYVGPWSETATYAVGDVCDREGRYYRCLVAHGSEYGGTWGPPNASVWDDLGPA